MAKNQLINIMFTTDVAVVVAAAADVAAAVAVLINFTNQSPHNITCHLESNITLQVEILIQS